MALKYLQIEEDLKNMILSEEIRPGDRLPSENVLSGRYSVSRQTVRKALSDLENEGYVYAVHGSGTFCSITGISIRQLSRRIFLTFISMIYT